MPEIICINCFELVRVKGNSLTCRVCESKSGTDEANYVPLATSAKRISASKAQRYAPEENPEQPTYLQMQTLIDEIREIKKLVSMLRWLVPIGFLIIIANIVVIGVKVNLSPTLFTPFNG